MYSKYFRNLVTQTITFHFIMIKKHGFQVTTYQKKPYIWGKPKVYTYLSI